jgi:hypothetical protein
LAVLTPWRAIFDKCGHGFGTLRPVNFSATVLGQKNIFASAEINPAVTQPVRLSCG